MAKSETSRFPILGALALLLGTFCSGRAMADATDAHSSDIVRCEPLPPIGSAEVAQVLGQLQKPGACPAGEFPSRYASGKQLPQDETCVNPLDYPGHFDLTDSLLHPQEPYTDVAKAADAVMSLSRMAQCPPGMQRWPKRSKDGFELPAGIAVDPHGNLAIVGFTLGRTD